MGAQWKAKHKDIAANAKGKLFGKLVKDIIIAARNGADPAANARLRLVVEQARKVSMPKDTLERAIKKGAGELEGVNYEEITYEGYGPGGVAILVETLTDNRNRTNGEVRSIFEKGGGNMGTPGCVGYLFERKGLFLIDAKKFPDEDAVMTAALEAEADDFKREGDFYEVTCDPAKFAAEADGYTATKHQREAGTGYFDVISTALNPDSATLALAGSTETAQFH